MDQVVTLSGGQRITFAGYLPNKTATASDR
jgi:hypothetical protein